MGSSCGGDSAVPYLVKRINKSSCSMILIPHIDNWEIEKSLSRKKIPLLKSKFIFDIEKKDFEKGKIYLSEYQRIDSSFEYLSRIFGKNLIGVILSGAGNDGAKGLKQIKLNGGKIFAQSKPNIFHYAFNPLYEFYISSMPEEAKKMNDLDYFGSLNYLAKHINKNLLI